jgi:hypothetical protein
MTGYEPGTPQPPSGPPPGWYNDPGGAPVLRWWDGTAWTPHTQALPAPPPGIPMEPAALPAEPAPAGPPPARHATPKRHRNAAIAVAGAAALLVLIIIITGVSGSGNTGSSTDAGNAAGAPSSSADAAAASSPSQSSCASQVQSWKNGGGGTQLDAVSSDLNSFVAAAKAFSAAADGNGDLSSAESSLQSASAALQTDAETAEANLPPSCVPGFRSDYGQGLADYAKVAADSQDAISEFSAGSTSVGLGDISTAVSNEDAGNAKLESALTALNAWKAAGES